MSENQDIVNNDNIYIYTDEQKHIDAGWEPATPDDHMTDEEKIYRLNIDSCVYCEIDRLTAELASANEQLSRYREALEEIMDGPWGETEMRNIAREALEPKP